jgi:enoyl-CoA hydratase
MEQLRHRIDGDVGVIELDNPPDQFMTAQMVAELDELTRAWERDPTVRAIVITGTKPGTFITHFSVHELAESMAAARLSELPAQARNAAQQAVRGIQKAQRVLERLPTLRKILEGAAPRPLKGLVAMAQIHRVFSRLERMDKAVIAAINGTAMGGGCELALACDYRLMARGDHVIGLIEVLGGIIPGAGGTQRLAAAVGRARAIQMILDGAVLSPDEAERAGLVTSVVDADRLMGEAMALARRLATRSPAAVGHAKRAVRVAATWPIDDGLAFEKLAFVLSGTTADAARLGAHYLTRFQAGASARQIFDELRAGGP